MDKTKYEIIQEYAKKEGAEMKGVLYLLNYYVNDLEWSMTKAVDYVLFLFESGTMKTIMKIAKGETV